LFHFYLGRFFSFVGSFEWISLQFSSDF
jgi:hypothetical protein